MNDQARSIALSLISHTNAGKTALARTLLQRDVGEVRDAPHVTTEATAYPLIETAAGDTLVLWDTPGFGDSAHLARRLAQQGNPIGWFLSQVWDRFRNQPFYLAQHAVRNVRDDADVVLYLVNAAEAPGDAGFLAPELELLAWIGRPVVVLLNQTGRPRPHALEEAEEACWRDALGARPFVHAVLTLDAFARCWVQESVLLRVLAPAIASEKRPAYDRLVAAWQGQRQMQFAEAMAVLAAAIAAAASDSVTLPKVRLKDALQSTLRSLVTGPSNSGDTDRLEAAAALATRLEAGLRASTERLIAIHGLAGHAAEEARTRILEHLHARAPLHQGKAAAVGGALSGALSGLAADLATGGLSFGGGTLVGALAGAFGGAGLARGFNVLRGRRNTVLRWDDALLDDLVVSALLRYLSVAHFGRGRGEWKEAESPRFWQEIVEQTMTERGAAFAALWAQRTTPENASTIEPALRKLLGEAARALLDALYPGALTGVNRQIA